MSIKVAITDDHPLIADGISKMLARHPQMEFLTHYATGAALLAGLKEQQPDVLLLDINLPDISGNELVRKLLPEYPELKILVLTSVDDPFEIQDMMQHGCLGYVQKTIAPETLLKAIETVYSGEQFLEPALKEMLVQTMLQVGQKTIMLNEKQQEILELICEGMTNMDIGQRLCLSHRTVEKYRLALYEKFNVTNTTLLLRRALQYKFIK